MSSISIHIIWWNIYMYLSFCICNIYSTVKLWNFAPNRPCSVWFLLVFMGKSYQERMKQPHYYFFFDQAYYEINSGQHMINHSTTSDRRTSVTYWVPEDLVSSEQVPPNTQSGGFPFPTVYLLTFILGKVKTKIKV